MSNIPTESIAIVWFKRDLRVDNHAALSGWLRAPEPVLRWAVQRQHPAVVGLMFQFAS